MSMIQSDHLSIATRCRDKQFLVGHVAISESKAPKPKSSRLEGLPASTSPWPRQSGPCQPQPMHAQPMPAQPVKSTNSPNK